MTTPTTGARLWVNDRGDERWQPQLGCETLWYEVGIAFAERAWFTDSSRDENPLHIDGPVLYRSAARAKRAVRREQRRRNREALREYQNESREFRPWRGAEWCDVRGEEVGTV